MANPDRQSKPEIARTEQAVQNWSFDEVFKVLTVQALSYDGANLVRNPTPLIPVPFTRITFSNPNGNTPPNYQTGTVKNGSTTVGTLTFTYDGYGTVTDFYWTAV